MHACLLLVKFLPRFDDVSFDIDEMFFLLLDIIVFDHLFKFFM